jgi:hypothetical protein
MARGRWWHGAIALLTLSGAGGVAASGGPSALTASAAAASWSPDPDEQLLLDVSVRQLTLGDGARAYTTPEGVCVVLGDFLNTLDVPMKIDVAAKVASGWAFKEENRVNIDRARGEVAFGTNREPLGAETVRDTPEGWCVDSKALGRWFGIGVDANPRASLLRLETKTKLPVELAIERRKRAEQIKPARLDLAGLPRVSLPYRMWRTPALDFVVSGGATYNAHSGLKVDRQASLYAAGEMVMMSFDARVGTNRDGIPDSVRLRAYRNDPDGELLGFMNATQVAVGDVAGLVTPLVGGSSQGRGALITNRPLDQPSAFDRTSFTGDLPNGWEAEIYRNGALLGFATAGNDNRYHFDDVQLQYGDNRFDIVTYGPQGQIRRRSESVMVGPQAVPPGKTWYWAGANQVGRDLVGRLGAASDGSQVNSGWSATMGVEHGLDKRTSVAALVETLVVDDKRLSYVEASVRRTVGPALVEIGGAYERGGGYAARASVIGRLGPVNISGESIVTRNFVSTRIRDGTVGQHRLSIDAPLKIGRMRIPVHGDVRLRQLAGGGSALEGAARLSTNFRNFMLSTELNHSRQRDSSGVKRPAETDLIVAGLGRIGGVRVRGSAQWDVAPSAKFRAAELSGYWSASDTSDWEGVLGYDGGAKRARARVSHIHHFKAMSVALSGEAATDGSVAAGFNVAFSLGSDRGGGLFNLTNQKLASNGAVRARVFRDDNDNGRRDPGEPLQKGATITAGLHMSDKVTDGAGTTRVEGLNAFRPVAIGVDTSTLADPSLVPRKAIQVVTPRPGVTAEVDIALVGGGDVEGSLVKSGGGGFEGLDVELVDSSGAVVATTRSDFDGYFLFERVAYGRYTIRLAQASAEAARADRDLERSLEITPEKPVVRMGAIPVSPLKRIALAPSPQ